MTTQEKIEVMKAYAEGRKIQVRHKEFKEWEDWENPVQPVWDWGVNDFRIKLEPVYRPYKDTDEMIADFKKRFNVEVPPYALPEIWLRNNGTKVLCHVSRFSDQHVMAFGAAWNMKESFDKFTYLDGSPCGIKEE